MNSFAFVAAFLATLAITQGYHHHNQHQRGCMKTLALMCASDSCVPRDIKDDIKSSWTDTGAKIWDHCVKSNGGACSEKNWMSVGLCGYQKLMNTTDITVKEARDTIINFGNKGLESCCGNTITLRMMTCSRTMFEHHGHHGQHGHHGHHGHHEQHRHHHGEHHHSHHEPTHHTEEEISERITMHIISE